MPAQEDQIMKQIRSKVSKHYQNTYGFKDGKHFFTVSYDGTARWYEKHLEEDVEEIQIFHLYQGTTFRYLQLSPDENTLYTGFADKTIEIWKHEQGRFQKFQIVYFINEETTHP